MSWWTSGSEAAALDTLFAAFRESNPDVDAVNGAVAGGAGSKAIVELAKRLQDGDPPDVWQTFTGKSVQGYARRGVVRSVASVFEREDLGRGCTPRSCARSCATASPYGVPTGRASQQRPVVQHEAARAGRRQPAVERLHARRVPGRPREGQGLRGDAAVPRRQGPVHHGRAVREHAAELDRDRAAGRTWSTTSSTGAATGCRTALKRFGDHARLHRPARRAELTWDQATQEARGGRLRVRVDERLRVRRAHRRRRAGGRGLRRDRLPRHRRELPRRRRRLRRRDEGEERQERARVPRRHQQAGHAARVQQGEGVGPGRPRRRRRVADRPTSGRPRRRCGRRRCCCRSPTARR